MPANGQDRALGFGKDARHDPCPVGRVAGFPRASFACRTVTRGPNEFWPPAISQGGRAFRAVQPPEKLYDNRSSNPNLRIRSMANGVQNVLTVAWRGRAQGNALAPAVQRTGGPCWRMTTASYFSAFPLSHELCAYSQLGIFAAQPFRNTAQAPPTGGRHPATRLAGGAAFAPLAAPVERCSDQPDSDPCLAPPLVESCSLRSCRTCPLRFQRAASTNAPIAKSLPWASTISSPKSARPK